MGFRCWCGCGCRRFAWRRTAEVLNGVPLALFERARALCLGTCMHEP